MLISKDDVVHHLVAVVPCIQFLIQWAVAQLGRVLVRVGERQERHRVCKRVRVECVRHIGIVTLYAVHTIEHPTNQEAVTVATPPQTGAKGLKRLQVSVAELSEQNHLLMKTFRVQSGIQQPQA